MFFDVNGNADWLKLGCLGITIVGANLLLFAAACLIVKAIFF